MLAPLPCWKHLEPEQRKKRIAALVKEIEEEAAAARKRNGIQVAGADAILAHRPHDRPEKLGRTSESCRRMLPGFLAVDIDEDVARALGILPRNSK